MFRARPLTDRMYLTGLFLVMFGSITGLQGQSSEYILKAGFMERFTRFIEWPDDPIQGDTTRPFSILVLGKNPFHEDLEVFFSKTKVKSRNVLISYASKLDTTQTYHMIFIGSSVSRDLKSILKYLRNKPIITVSDTEGFGLQGVMINFYVENNKIRFEINQEAVKASRLKVSHLLWNIAKII